MVHLSLDQLVHQIDAATPGEDALRRLSLAALGSEELTSTADELVGHYIARAREAGASWADIGSALGVTKQAAQQRHQSRSNDVDDLVGLDDECRAALEQARREAVAQRHHYVGTEHVLVGVLRTRPELADALGCTADEALETALVLVGRGQVEVPRPPLLTARCRKTLDLAAAASAELGHASVSPADLLRGVVQEGRGVAARVLDQRGGGLDRVRSVLEALDG
jgi:hypothetical protein